VLYPDGLPTERRLDHYVREFCTVELNASHYRWPADASFTQWRWRVPSKFVMSVKAPRALTHAKRLYGPESWVARMARGLGCLGSCAGVVLVQLPPTAEFDRARLAYFLQGLPATLRVCVEFRHPSWHQDATFELLQEHGAAYCVMSGANLPCILRATAPFVYCRWHGPTDQPLYAGRYSPTALADWAEQITRWRDDGRTVWGYFDNDGSGHAPANARELLDLLG